MDDRPERGAAGRMHREAADRAVRQTLVESHRDLLRFLRRRLRNSEAAEEVLQRFILKALERSKDLRDVRSVRAWLGRVLATTIVDFQRTAATRRRREQVFDPRDLARRADQLIEPDPEIDEAICHCLYKLLPTLKPEYAEAIWQIDLLGEPRDRLAESLGTNVNNITVRLHRARQALRNRLEQMCRTCVEHGFLDCECSSDPEQRQVERC